MPGEAAPARLVIRTPNWLGDAIMALPAMAAVRQAFPESHLAVAAPAGIAPLFAEKTDVRQDEVVVIGARQNEAVVLSAGRFDAVLLLPNSFRSAWVAREAGIAKRWGYGGIPRGWMLTRAARRPRGPIHQAEYYRELVQQVVEAESGSVRPKPDATGSAVSAGSGFRLRGERFGGRGGASAEAVSRTITITDGTARRAGALLAREGIEPGRPLVGFAPGAAYGHAKRWPPLRVAEVIARLTAERGAVCLLVGVEGDAGAGREIESALPPNCRVVNLIGRTDLRLLSGVLARCAAFVSNDSGAMHLAAALGVPVAAIFGPTNERATAPLGEADVLVHQVFCRPCMLRECPIDHRCMKGISPGVVFDVIDARLAAAKVMPQDAPR